MTMPLKEQLVHLQAMAETALARWDIAPDAQVSLLNVSENTTYLVQDPDGKKAVLRIHREKYHSKRAIESELTWLDALGRDTDVVTPGYYAGRDGEVIQELTTPGLPTPRFAVLFHFLDGAPPDETDNRRAAFEDLGAIAARCHLHTQAWERPASFERLVWDVDAVFGSAPTWGDWRDAPNVDDTIRPVLEQVEQTIRARLAAYGNRADRYNLIHADMRLANLLVNGDGIRVIDFDDCGMGWFMYDFAAAISFIEDDPDIPQLKEAWLKGYTRVRDLGIDDIAEIDTFIMLRRMALLAWIGSHIEAPEPQALAPDFAANTAKLAKVYLDQIAAHS